MESVNYKHIYDDTKQICKSIEVLIDKLSDDEYSQKEQWRNRLNKVIPKTGEPLKIALVGEYDAGKSSIIKVLTNKVVLINSNVATSDVKIYEYQGIKLIDMPGTLSGLDEHDQKAFEAAAESDLLLYVITNELFNASNIKNFFETIDILKKSKQTMLVVNQIDRVNLMEREIDEAIGIMKEELEIRVRPYALDDLIPVFISARNYIDSLSEDDEEIKTELFESSSINTLVDGLNEFCESRGINGRLARPLQSLLAIIDSIRQGTSEENNEFDIINNYYARQKRIFVECENKIRSKSNKLRVEKKREVRELATPIIQIIEEKGDSNEIAEAYQKADDKLQELIDCFSDNLKSTIKDPMLELQQDLEEFDKSPISNEFKEILFNGNISLDEYALSKQPTKIPGFMKSGLKEGMDNIGKQLIDNADEFAIKFVEIYKKIMNVKFKPYGKIKLTDKAAKVLGKAGKAIGWLAVGWDLYCNLKEESDKGKWEKKLRETKASIKSTFIEAGKTFESTIDECIENFIESELRSKTKIIDEQRAKLNDSDSRQKTLRENICLIENRINETLLKIN
jgi:GTP-binding protein EngB required for normal cell division